MSENSTNSTGPKGNTTMQSVPYKKWCFTLNNYTKDELSTELPALLHQCDGYIYGEEIGELKGTPHLQGYFELKGRKRFETLCNMIPRASFRKAKGNRQHNIIYCSKGKNLQTTWPLPMRIQLLQKYYSNVVWRPWQQHVLNILSEQPDERTIHWFWEPTGRVGKSFLVKYLKLTREVILGGGRTRDILHAIAKKKEKNESYSPEIVIADCPRLSLEYVQYPLLEKLKDGCVYSGKYEGCDILLDRLHLICFANEEPKKYAVSNDRWNIVQIK